MNRILLAALGVTLATVVIFQFTGPASSATPVIQGDADCNGVVEPPDIVRVLSVVADEDDMAGCDVAATDTDCDDETEVDDALHLLFYLAGFSGPPANPGCAGIGSPAPTQVAETATAEVTTGGLQTPTQTAQSSGTPPVTETATATPEPSATPPFCPGGIPTASPQAQTPTATAPATNGYHILKLVECPHFAVPTDFTAVPGHPDEALVSTQEGLVWRISVSGQFEPTLAADLTDRVTRVSDEGLLSITFQPGDDDYVYVNYSTGTAYDLNGFPAPPGNKKPSGCDGVPAIANPPDPKRSVVARFPFANNKLTKSGEHVILEIDRPHCWHTVDQLVFDPTDPDIMFIGSGDGGGIGSPYDDHVNPLNNLLGVVMRIRIRDNGSYAVPADNPFVSTAGAMPEIWANEFRNPWRLAVDSVTGAVWAGDVGQEKWEEVDKVEKGANYGWNKMEGAHCFPPLPTPASTTPPTPTATASPSACYDIGMELPVVEYSHATSGCSITVGYVYHGTAMPELDGYLIYGDYCSGRIWALNTGIGGGSPIELVNTTAAIVSFGRTGDGELVILDRTGAIFQLVRN